MLRDAETADPFGLASTPSAYVARASSERAMRALDEVLASGGIPGLIGPPGLGKTLLLQRVAARLDDSTAPVYVPFSTLSLRELCKLVLGLVEEPVTNDPEDAFRQILDELRRERASLLLLIDDVAMMPIETARQLAEWVESSKGTLKLALAAIESEDGRAVFEAFGDRLTRIRLDEEMSFEETCEYVERRLAIVGAPQSIRDAFDPATVEALYEASGGNPRSLNIEAQSIVRAASPPDTPRLVEIYDPSLYEIDLEEPAPIAAEERVVCEAPAHSADEVLIEEIPPFPDRAPVAPDPSQPTENSDADGAYRVVRGRSVVNDQGDLGAYEGRATLERIPSQAATIAAEIDAVDGPDEPELQVATPAPEPERVSTLQSFLALGDAITRKPLALTASLAAAIVLGIGFGSLVGPATVGTQAPTAPVETAPVATPSAPETATRYPIGINATPWALIEVDGEARGETPIAGLELPAGVHTIRAYYPDGHVEERVVEIDERTHSVVF